MPRGGAGDPDDDPLPPFGAGSNRGSLEQPGHVPSVEAIGALGRLDARIGELEERGHARPRCAEERFGHLVLVLVAVGETELEIEVGNPVGEGIAQRDLALAVQIEILPLAPSLPILSTPSLASAASSNAPTLSFGNASLPAIFVLPSPAVRSSMVSETVPVALESFCSGSVHSMRAIHFAGERQSTDHVAEHLDLPDIDVVERRFDAPSFGVGARPPVDGSAESACTKRDGHAGR